MADLGAWVTEEYRVSGDAIDPDAEEDGSATERERNRQGSGGGEQAGG